MRLCNVFVWKKNRNDQKETKSPITGLNSIWARFIETYIIHKIQLPWRGKIMRALCGLLIVILTLGPVGMGMLLSVDAPIMELDTSPEMVEESFSSDHGTRSAPVEGPKYVELYFHSASTVMNITENWGSNPETATADITFTLDQPLGTDLWVGDDIAIIGMRAQIYVTGSGLASSSITVMIYENQGGIQIGEGTYDFSSTIPAPSLEPIDIIFESQWNNNYNFTHGNYIVAEFSVSNGAAIYYDSESRPSNLRLYCKSITDIEVETVNHAGYSSRTFFPRDLNKAGTNRREVTIRGDIEDAFTYAVEDGPANVYYIDYVQLHIQGPGFNDDRNASWKPVEKEYEYDWGYSNGIADGEYTVTAHVVDDQGNEFTASNTFNISAYGVALTSPHQDPEEGKFGANAFKNCVQNETTTYIINVWNIGNEESTIDIETTPSTSGWTYVLGGSNITLDSGSKSGSVENLPAGQSLGIELTVDGYDKALNDYVGITVTARCSEDPDPKKGSSLYTETLITMRYDVELEFDDHTKSQSKNVEIGDEVSYDFTVKNNGASADTIWLEIGNVPSGWTATLSGDELQSSPTYEHYVQLAPNDKTDPPLTLTITTPTTGGDTTVSIHITAKSVGSYEQDPDNVVSDTITTITTMTSGVKLELIGGREKDTDPDEDVTFQFELTNTGTGPANFTVTFTQPSSSDGWSTGDVSFAANYLKTTEDFDNLNTDSPQTINLYVLPTIDVRADNYTITVTAVKEEDSTRSAWQDVFCIVNEKHDIQIIKPLDGVLYGKAEPGKDVTYEIEIANYGNTAETVIISVAAPDKWKVDFGNANNTWSDRLEPKQLEVIPFTFTVPEDAEGDQTVDITVSVVPAVSDAIIIETHTEIESIWYQPLMMLLVPILLFVVIVVMVVVIYKRR